jgi:hypothetical protein
MMEVEGKNELVRVLCPSGGISVRMEEERGQGQVTRRLWVTSAFECRDESRAGRDFLFLKSF